MRKDINLLYRIIDDNGLYGAGRLTDDAIHAIHEGIQAIKAEEQRKAQGLVDIDVEDFGTLAICALRYCHGRRSYMPGLVQGIVIDNLEKLTDKDLFVISEDKRFQESMNLWGDEKIDKPDWYEFYKVISRERERRKNDTGIHHCEGVQE